ncbi:hypothetical protein Taro_046600, partial [Colocasia esculenta]|nr:hypothetical protein [Colocasia esculenta]
MVISFIFLCVSSAFPSSTSLLFIR